MNRDEEVINSISSDLKKTSPLKYLLSESLKKLIPIILCFQAIYSILIHPVRFFNISLIERKPSDILPLDNIIKRISPKALRVIHPFSFVAIAITVTVISTAIESHYITAQIESSASLMELDEEVKKNPKLFSMFIDPSDNEFHEQIEAEIDIDKQLILLQNKLKSMEDAEINEGAVFDIAPLDSALEQLVFDIMLVVYVYFYSYVFLFITRSKPSQEKKQLSTWFWMYVTGFAIALPSLVNPLIISLIPESGIPGALTSLLAPTLLVNAPVFIYAWSILPIIYLSSFLNVSRLTIFGSLIGSMIITSIPIIIIYAGVMYSLIDV